MVKQVRIKVGAAESPNMHHQTAKKVFRLTLVLIALLVIPNSLRAQSFFSIPITKNTLLLITNQTQETLSFQAFYHVSNESRGYPINIEVAPFETETVALSKYHPDASLFFLWRGPYAEGDFGLKVQVKQRARVDSYTPTSYASQVLEASAINLEMLSIHSLSQQICPVRIVGIDKNFNSAVAKDISLDPYGKTQLEGDLLEGALAVRIFSSCRLKALGFYKEPGGEHHASPAEIVDPLKIAVPEGAFFLVGSPGEDPHGPRPFVINLKDPLLEGLAREVLKTPGMKKVVRGRIKKEFSYNRDMAAPGAPIWSWSLEVTQISDFDMISCNTNAEIIENLIWALEDSSEVCFWAYNILSELNPEALASGTLPPKKILP